MTVAHAFRERVNKHARSRRLEIVPFGSAFIEYLVPESGAWLLILRHGARETIQDRDQFCSLGMVLRKVVECVNEGHRVPAHSASPEIWRTSGLRVGPTLLSRLIPAVIEQSGFVVARMALHENELLRDVV